MEFTVTNAGNQIITMESVSIPDGFEISPKNKG